MKRGKAHAGSMGRRAGRQGAVRWALGSAQSFFRPARRAEWATRQSSVLQFAKGGVAGGKRTGGAHAHGEAVMLCRGVLLWYNIGPGTGCRGAGCAASRAFRAVDRDAYVQAEGVARPVAGLPLATRPRQLGTHATTRPAACGQTACSAAPASSLTATGRPQLPARLDSLHRSAGGAGRLTGREVGSAHSESSLAESRARQVVRERTSSVHASPWQRRSTCTKDNGCGPAPFWDSRLWVSAAGGWGAGGGVGARRGGGKVRSTGVGGACPVPACRTPGWSNA